MKNIFTFNKLSVLLLIVSLSSSLAGHAVPAKPGLRTITQPDGTELKVRVIGDERGHFIKDTEGRILIKNADGAYYYSTLNNENQPVASEIMAKPSNQLSSSEAQQLASINFNNVANAYQNRISNSSKGNSPKAIALRTKANAAPNVSARDSSFRMLVTNYPSTGSPKALVILVNFSDVSFTISNPYQHFYDMLNKEGYTDYGHIGSCHDYFKKCSMGKFTPEFDVYGPVTLNKTMAYYGQNDATYDDDIRPEEVVIDACKILDQTTNINFADYDTDGDGLIDNVYIFYAGYGEADGGSTNSIWPHSWDVYYGAGRTCYLDGKLLTHYAMSNELANGRGTSPAGIGTFTHEFSHVMGLPDLYDIYYSNGTFTPGSWNILDDGSYNGDSKIPPLYSAFERFSLGWIKPIELYKSTNLELEPIADANTCFITYTDQPQEFFLFEYRKQSDFDKYIPNSGMLVYHIDYKPSIWEENTVNTILAHQYVDLIEADNRPTEQSRAGDCFPGTSNITSFSPTTKPAFEDWTGNSLETYISNIKLDNGKLTMDVDSPNLGVTSTIDDESNLNILISGNQISNYSGFSADVYDLLGRKVTSISNGNSVEMSSSGIYIIRAGKKAKKILIK